MPTVAELKAEIVALGAEPKGKKADLEAQLAALTQVEEPEPPAPAPVAAAGPRMEGVTPTERARIMLAQAEDFESAVRALMYRIDSGGTENQVGSEWVSKVREYL